LRIPLTTPTVSDRSPRGRRTLAAVEKEHITSVIAACGGWPLGKNRSAARLGLSPDALQAKMAELGLNVSGG
jgi:DNA-binding NtrC family response regulator